MEKLDKIFSEYIRIRDSDEYGFIRCISCGRRVHWKEADAGHYIPRSHKSTRWNEKNVNTQCRQCNRYENGNLEAYRIGLIKKYGFGTLEELKCLKLEIAHISNTWIKDKIKYYQQKYDTATKVHI